MTVPAKVVPIWGREHPTRGIRHHDLAVSFIEDFPIGTQLSQDRFGEWLQQRNILVTASGNSLGRRDYIYWRKEWRDRINAAASHSRMNETVGVTFTIEVIAQQTLEVRSCIVALAVTDNVRPIELRTEARRRKMSQWAAGIDWSQHDPHVKDSATLLFKFSETLRKHAEVSHRDYCDAIGDFTAYLQTLKLLPGPSEASGDGEPG
jgi:hypothetical protein